MKQYITALTPENHVDRMTMPETILSPHSQKILDALQWQGARNDCGPYTTATVLNAMLATQIQAEDLAEEMNHPAWRGILLVVRRIPDWATFPWGMVDIFKQYGLNSTWRFFTPVEELKENLVTGKIMMPINGSWKEKWAHVMTLVAWDEEKGFGFANTQFNHHNIDWHPEEAYVEGWKATGRLLVEVRPV